MKRLNLLLVSALAIGVVACSEKPAAPIAPAVAPEPQDIAWTQHGRDAGEQRFAEIDQINRDNVNQLSLAWYVDLPEARGQEATPLVIDGIMYTTSAWNHVHAIDAKTGQVLWSYDPKVPKETLVKACCGAVNRGAAYLDGTLFTGTLDGRLIALDAETGALKWEKVTVDQDKPYTITGAPRVYNGKVYIGNGGAEYGVRGYLSAYDAETGDVVWRFYTVPGGPDAATGVEPIEAQKATWAGEYWRLGGGGTVWDSMALDAETNTLYFGVGNGSPWNPNTRTNGEGDNWFLSSIVAVDADSGEYKWHYQTTPQEGWDFTATQHIMLATLPFNGEQRDVVMQAPKNGFFYVLDRHTGELLSAEPYVPVNWATHVDMATGRPVLTEEAQYWVTGKPALVTPSWMGGHNWHPMSFNPDTGLVYLPAQETAFPYLGQDDQTPAKLAVNLGVDTKAAALPDDPAVIKQVKDATKGFLVAWDPTTGKPRWKVEYPGAWNGGTLSTAGGLVFQGSAVGFVYAYDAATGERVWEFPAQTGVVAPPISYTIDGEQYITVSAGWGGIFPLMTGILVEDAAGERSLNTSRLLTFKLGGEAALPEALDRVKSLPDTSAITVDPDKVAEGFATYDRFCVNCHGAGAVAGGVLPDLRFSPIILDTEAWYSIVSEGALKDRGMVGYGSELSDDQVEAIRHFLIERNQQARREGFTERYGR